jgi:glucose dehydrogenase
MVAPLDVFAVNNGEPKWLGCAESLAQATDLIRKTGAGSYFVFSQETGHKNFYELTTDGVVSQVRQTSTS